MKILLDENISWRIKKYLNFDIENIIHVADISDLRLNDEDIWNYALNNDCIILTHDSDFVDLVTLRGFPPKIIQLRTGKRSRLEEI
jgi:predicted nuclease of predicted toxin-antitoxin system